MLTIEDRHDIAETLAHHAFVFDENQLDRLGELFVPDAVYDMSAAGMGTYQGIAAIGAAAAALSENGHAPRTHLALRHQDGRWLISRRVITPVEA